MYKHASNPAVISYLHPSLSFPLSTLCRANNLSIQESRLLVGKVLDIAKDSAGSFGGQSLLGAVVGLPLEDGLDAVLAVVGHLDDRPLLQAELTPVLLDEGHVGREVIVHVELGTLGVDDLGGVSVVVGRQRERVRLYGGASSRHCDELDVCAIRTVV